MIAAMAVNRVIGKDNALPWRMPADLAHFKRTTMGKPVIMGRLTWQSMPGPLPGRQNIVITRNTQFTADGADVVHTIDQAIECAGDADEVFIIGGQKIYEAALPRADRIYLTIIHGEYDGDTWFPELDESQWQLTDRQDHPADERHVNAYSFCLYARKSDVNI